MATRNARTKNQASNTALDALAEGRVADALLILTQDRSLRDALEIMAPDPEPKIGDILSSSWGYDQTNIDWYEVVAVTPTRSSVKLRKIASRVIADRGSSVLVMPIPGTPDPGDRDGLKLKRIRKSSYGYTVTIESYADAHLWDGEPLRETASGYGH